jgi:hypothetical protein
MVQGQVAGRRGQAAGAPERLRAAARRPWVREAAVLAGFLAAGVAATWPLTSYLAGRLPASRDVAIYVWDMWWVAHQIIHLHNPWSTTYLAAPAGLQLGYHTLVPLLGALMAPVTLAFGPSGAYNLLVIAVPGLACYAMYRVARLWLPTLTGAIAAGAFFGLSAMLTYQAWYHLNIAYGTVFLPLTLEAAVRLRRDPGLGRGVILGVVLGASVLVNQESAVMALILAVLVLVPWLAGLRSADAALKALRALAAAAVAGGLVASPQLVAMIQQARAGGSGASAASLGYAAWVASLPSLFAPSPRLADDGLTGLGHIYTSQTRLETMNTFGVVLSLLAVLGVVACWRRRSTWLLLLLWLAGAALSLGPVLYLGHHLYVPSAQLWQGVRVSALMPYTWFIRIPGLSIFREADRLALLGLAGAALLAGAAVDWLAQRGRAAAGPKRWWPWLAILVVAACGGLEAGWSGTPGGLPVMPTAFPALDAPIAADHTSSVVVDVPFGLDNVPSYGSQPYAQAIVMATADGHPRAICYTSWVPARTIAAIQGDAFYASLTQAQLGHAVGRVQTAQARANVRTLHVGWVVVWLPKPVPALSRYLSATGFTFAYRADGASVYRPAAS